MKLQGLSVFDLDKTLLSVNCSFQFGIYLFQKKFLSFYKMLVCAIFYFRHRFLGLSVRKLHEKVFEVAFRGKSSCLIDKYVQQFLDEKLAEMVYKLSLAALEADRKKGKHILILSSSPDFLVEAIAKRLQASSWKATEYWRDKNGLFCGLKDFVEGTDKAVYVKRLVEELKLDLKDVTAYADSYLDLPLLELVGFPVMVNPDGKLKAFGHSRAWKVI